MKVSKIIEDAWSKTIEDFRNAMKSGEAGLWTEASLRLNFVRHLNEVAKVDRILAEARFHLGNDDYKPDIVADVIVDDDAKRVAFEMKLFGQIEYWKRDLQKLDKYSVIGWDYGYFLAIGYPQQCDDIRKEHIEKSLTHYEIRILTQSASKSNVVPDFKFAESVLRETLGKDIPYIVNEIQGAFAFYEKYVLIFDMIGKENKLAVRAALHNTPEEQKVKELGYSFITFDEEGKIYPSKTSTDEILIGEFDFRGMITSQVATDIKEPLRQFMEKMDNLQRLH